MGSLRKSKSPTPIKPQPRRRGKTLAPKRSPKDPHIAERHPSSATEALHGLRSVAHEADLRRIHSKLEGVLSAVIVVQHALMENNCEIDDDAADVLRISSDELDRQIEQIEILLGEPPRDERGEDDGGAI